MRMLLGFFGWGRSPATLSQRDWDRFIREQRAGRVRRSGRPVSDRTVEYDLNLLIAIFNWASKSRDERGRLLLDANPLRGLKTRREKIPTRMVLDEDEHQALFRASREMEWRVHVALVLAHETGHRIGAIRQLLWPDFDLEAGVGRWRAGAREDRSSNRMRNDMKPSAQQAHAWQNRQTHRATTPVSTTGSTTSPARAGLTPAARISDAPVLARPRFGRLHAPRA